MTDPISVLVVDDEPPQLDELCFLLGRDQRVGTVRATGSAGEALRLLRGETPLRAVFLDIQMPGLSGLELARVLRGFEEPPSVVFVTAHEEHAVQAFELEAVDYVLKPVRAERLRRAVTRVLDHVPAHSVPGLEEQIAVELGGITRFVNRRDVGFAEAQGDYARLHTRAGTHLLRTPLSALEQSWAGAGFVRIHRSLLVNLAHVTSMRTTSGRCSVFVLGNELQVSRRHTRELRELIGAHARQGSVR